MILSSMNLLEKRNSFYCRYSSARCAKTASRKGDKVEITESLKTYIGNIGFDPEFGARPMKRAITQILLNPLSEKILSGEIQEWKNYRLERDEEHGIKSESSFSLEKTLEYSRVFYYWFWSLCVFWGAHFTSLLWWIWFCICCSRCSAACSSPSWVGSWWFIENIWRNKTLSIENFFKKYNSSLLFWKVAKDSICYIMRPK